MKINNLKNTAGIKIKTNTASADLIKLIKQHRNDAISEIKSDILNYDYVYVCSFSGDSGKFEKLINLYKELISLGYNAVLFDEDHESTIEFFNNWLETMKDTDRFVENDDIFAENTDE